VYRKYQHKSVLYHDADLSITPLRTISPSIEQWQYNAKHKRTAHYLGKTLDAITNAEISFDSERDYLYSFVGSSTHAVRTALVNMHHDANVFVKDTTGLQGWELSGTDRNKYEQEYVEVMVQSFFVLCPRGLGPCTYRLFECMQLGRVPVIISDSWVPTPGVNWEEFSIRVNEKDIPLLPGILNTRKHEAVEMGRKARLSWEQHFSPEMSLEQIANSAMELIEYPYTRKDFLAEHLQFFKRFYHLQNYLRYRKNAFKRKFRRV
jgi:hypothetical protein